MEQGAHHGGVLGAECAELSAALTTVGGFAEALPWAQRAVTLRPGDPRALVGFFHRLHSGETFGPLGVAIGTLSGFAMIFFSFSGLWMYLQMWRNRAGRGLTPRWFWE